MMIDYQNIVIAGAAYFVATLTPGPATLAIMATAMHQGRRSAVFMVFGIVITSVSWATAAALGLASLMQAWGVAFVVIKTVGGLYLLWLAFRAARSALNPVDDTQIIDVQRRLSDWQSFRRGLVIHASTPKAAFAWIAIISIGLDSNASLHSAFVLIAGCSVIGIVTFGFYALAFSTDFMISVYRRARRGIEAVMATLFGLAGLRLLSTRFTDSA